MLVARPASRPSALERAAAAKMKAFAFGSHDLEARALKLIGDDREVAGVLTRANQTLGTTGGWATELANGSLGQFLASLVPESAAARLIAQGLKITFKPGAESVSVPVRNGAPTALPWRAEGDPIAVRQYVTAYATTLTPKSFGGITVITKELAKRSDAQAIFTAMLREDLSASLDLAYFSDTASSSAAHPGLLNGVSALAAYGSADEVGMKTDLTALTDAIAAGGSGQVVFVVSAKRAMRMPILSPTMDLTILTSPAVADDVVIAVDPASIVHAFGDEPPEIDVSETAVVHLSTVPLEIVSDTGPTTADPVRSFYQTAAIGIRILGEAAFGKRRTNAVAWLSGAMW